MAVDSSPEVRRAALQTIVLNQRTLPALLQRTRDSSDLVRRAAFELIAQKVHMRSITIAKRVRVLSDLLHDRSGFLLLLLLTPLTPLIPLPPLIPLTPLPFLPTLPIFVRIFSSSIGALPRTHRGPHRRLPTGHHCLFSQSTSLYFFLIPFLSLLFSLLA